MSFIKQRLASYLTIACDTIGDIITGLVLWFPMFYVYVVPWLVIGWAATHPDLPNDWLFKAICNYFVGPLIIYGIVKALVYAIYAIIWIIWICCSFPCYPHGILVRRDLPRLHAPPSSRGVQ
jgi:hypothetical protein